MKIVDPLTGEIVAPGVVGELCARGYMVMHGYFENADATAEAIDADGWYHTGDLASMDERGYCRIEGRLKDMIIRGGENIYPREIEDVLVHASRASATSRSSVSPTTSGASRSRRSFASSGDDAPTADRAVRVRTRADSPRTRSRVRGSSSTRSRSPDRARCRSSSSASSTSRASWTVERYGMSTGS